MSIYLDEIHELVLLTHEAEQAKIAYQKALEAKHKQYELMRNLVLMNNEEPSLFL